MTFTVGTYVTVRPERSTGQWFKDLVGIITHISGDSYDVYFFDNKGCGHTGDDFPFPGKRPTPIDYSERGHWYFSVSLGSLVKASGLNKPEPNTWPPEKKIVYRNFSATRV